MKLYTRTAFRNLLLVCACACVASAQTTARAGTSTPEVRAAKVSFADGVSLLNSIKDVESPAARAYLYARLAAWLWRNAGDDPSVRQAAELIAAVEENRAGLPEEFSRQDEILIDIVEESLKGKDLDTAAYAASKVGLAMNAAAAWRSVARYHLKTSDAQAATERLELAAKALADAPDRKGKAAAYLNLSADFLELDLVRASQMAAEAVKAANHISRPKETKEGEFSWSLFPLADATTKTFQELAQKDRGGASTRAASRSSASSTTVKTGISCGSISTRWDARLRTAHTLNQSADIERKRASVATRRLTLTASRPRSSSMRVSQPAARAGRTPSASRARRSRKS